MNPTTHILILLLLAASISPAIAEVYKRTNPDGSVEFTDVPNKQEEEPVPLSPMSTFKAPTPPPPIRSTAQPTSTDSKYTAVTITSPANEATIRDNTGALEIAVSIEPALQAEHKLVLLMDGTPSGESTTGTFSLSNVDRGEHTLSAQIQDAEGNTLISAPPVTVYLHRQSIIKPQRRSK